MIKFRRFLLLILFLNLNSCKDCETENPSISIENVQFSDYSTNSIEYFSTDGSMSSPVDSNSAKLISDKIDITYINCYYFQANPPIIYHFPGFMDPVTRSQQQAGQFFKPWLSNAIETHFFITTLTKSQFDDAKLHQEKIAIYFSDSSFVHTESTVIGGCSGGLHENTVYGFKNISNNKKGFMYVKWGDHCGGFNQQCTEVKVDFIKEK